jgi:hypothetical protein
MARTFTIPLALGLWLPSFLAGGPVRAAPALSLSQPPEAPQVGGLLVSPAEPAPVPEDEPAGAWRFGVTGFFRAPLRMSWGPATTPDPRGGDAGTQIRAPALVPDANPRDWRYTGNVVGPWTELDFHYGNDRVSATVQIASLNVTDPGYRRLEANLGINQAFVTMRYPELGSDKLYLRLTVGGFTNRYGAAGRYDAGKYETYLFGRTHTAGETANLAYDWQDWTLELEEGFGAKLEPIPFYGPPYNPAAPNPIPNPGPNQSLPGWEPYPGPVAQEPTFIAHAHLGVTFKKQLVLAAHWIDVFANGNQLSSAYQMTSFGARPSTGPGSARPGIVITGAEARLRGGVLGDGYVGYSRLTASNALYLADAVEVLHSAGGWQLHDNFFGPPGGTEPATGTVDSVELQYSLSFAQRLRYPQVFQGEGPDLVATLFGMFNHVRAPMSPAYDGRNKLKAGAELTYTPLPWLGLGGRYDFVEPNTSDSASSFSVFSPRLICRSSFVTHEQVILQYSRYFYGSAAATATLPYVAPTGVAPVTGADRNALQITALIWF